MNNDEIIYWAKIKYHANTGNKKAQEMLRQENELRKKSGKLTVQEEMEQARKRVPYINSNPNEKDLNKILMEDGKETAQEFLMTQPEKYWKIATAAIYECMKRGWTLHIGHIQMIARELAVPGNPNGW